MTDKVYRLAGTQVYKLIVIENALKNERRSACLLLGHFGSPREPLQ